MRNKAVGVDFFILTVVFFIYSYWLISIYTHGDQITYIRFYNAIQGLSLSGLMVNTYMYLGSYEPLSPLILWVGSNLGIEKNGYIAFLNTVMLMGLYLLFKKYRFGWFVLLLLLTNFYILVMLTSAERLKIAFIFLIYALLVSNKKHAALLAGLAVFSHFQAALFVLPVLIYHNWDQLKRLFLHFKVSPLFLVLSILFFLMVMIFIMFFQQGISSKLDAYMGSRSIFVLVNFFALLVLVLLITEYRFKVFWSLFSLAPFIFILGPERINMVAFFVAVYFLMREFKLKHPLFLFILFYFIYKSVVYMNNVMIYGEGFNVRG